MPKLTLTDIESGYASVAALNANFTAIETAIENTVSRDGTSPNTLTADLDVNGNGLLNVGSLTVNGIDVAGLTTSATEAAASAAAALVSEQNAAASEAVVVSAAGDLLYLEYEGAWVTATLYKVNNIVYVSSTGGSYICLVEHTADADFTVDLGAGRWGTLATQGAAGAGTGDMLKAENLSGLANYTTARSNMGLSIGTHVQAYDAELAAIAGLTSAANKVPMFSGSGTATVIDFLDEDAMGSNSATAVPSQQSVKAYVDTRTSNLSTAPGFTGITNVQYIDNESVLSMRVHNMVQVVFYCTLKASADGYVRFEVPLPYASNLTAIDDLSGVAGTSSDGVTGGGIFASSITDKASVNLHVTGSAGTKNIHGTFMYIVK
jgi:hypothetical protein